MTVGEIIYRILGDDTQFNSVMGKVGATASKALGAISKAALAVTGAAATAVSALAKSAVDGYAEYEQLVGGVETLFKDSADVIQGYADEAYKTAGMSANAYMETVTGFSASLLQGLQGDTAKAAEIANQAVIDMSDNANKMGTDMAMIQNAYQGFAKQNYTMLDNLKLGYGGTQSEMARLINDSGVLGDAMTVTAETVNSVSFDKIIEAIHVIQTDMGITGTTAKEAATTIQGSISSMQGAWENLMVGLADPTQDFDRLLGNLIDSVITVSDNLMPRIMAVLPQMAVGVTELANNLLPLIPETLEKMLPDVLEGANKLVSALLETLSSIADTAIPIVTENADEIIDTLLTGLVSAVPKLASSAADLCTALITAILDNADIITQGAVDIVLSLAEGIGNNLDTLIPVMVDAAITIIETLLDNADKLIDAGVEIIGSLAKGLSKALPELVQEAPAIIEKLVVALMDAQYSLIVEVPEAICDGIAEGLKNYDWADGASQAIAHLDDAMKQAADNIAAADGYEILGSQEEAEARLEASLKELEEKNGELSDSFIEIKKTLLGYEEELSLSGAFGEEAAKRAEEEARKHFGGYTKAAEEETEKLLLTGDELKEAVTKIDNAYDLGNYSSEKAYWADRLALLEANRNEEDNAWIKYYSQTKEHYEKAIETEAKAAERAAKEQESALKSAVEDKFRELETEQLEKDYDDSWLLEQERAYLETLDHNSEAYKDYNLRLLKEQEKADSAALKEAEQSAKKQKDAVEKAYNSVVSSRDKLSDSLKNSTDIFNSSEETDKRTGEKKKSRSIDISEFEKKLAAKKKLTEKIAELYEKDVPDSLVSELLKQDPEDALAYANQLLKDPKKLSKIRSMFKEDEGVSNIIANMVTENSSEFEKLGTDAGALFGESFSAAFKENWENALSSVFGEEYIASAAVTVSSANAQAGRESTAPVSYGGNTQSAGGGTSMKKADTGGNQIYKILDLNGSYVAKVVREENNRRNTVGGG